LGVMGIFLSMWGVEVSVKRGAIRIVGIKYTKI